MGRSSKDKRDIFYRLAKEEGWRARSAFKLLQISQHFKILENIHRAVDLCAAPGSWSQVLAQTLKPLENPENRIVAVDLQDMAPIPGVEILKGDITRESTAEDIIKLLGDSKSQIVVCDGAPDVTGYHQFDEYLQAQLVLAALQISALVLEPKGTFVAKVFRSSIDGMEAVYSRLQLFFDDVIFTKPTSSRVSSVECFVLGRGFRLPENYTKVLYKPLVSQTPVEDFDLVIRDSNGRIIPNARKDSGIIIPFISCGDLDGFNSDTTYPLEPGYVSLPPVQPPINPPYQEALRRRKTKTLDTDVPHRQAFKPHHKQPKGKKLLLNFGGGAELLVKDSTRELAVELPYNPEGKYSMRLLLKWMAEKILVDRPELLIKDGDIRPGILVLINDMDWELLDKLEYELEDNDKVSFISTLHGG